MSAYICYRCGTRIDVVDANADIICPSCACKILIKETPAVVKRVGCD